MEFGFYSDLLSGDIVDSGYILEDLKPRATYDLRFGSKNRVGFSVWGARQQITMPRKGRPEPPVLNTDQLGEVGERGEVVELNSSNSYELSWQIPEDNGLPIDYFLLQYYPVRLRGKRGKPMVAYTRPGFTQNLIIHFASCTESEHEYALWSTSVFTA